MFRALALSLALAGCTQNLSGPNCEQGLSACADICVNFQADNDNCGACDVCLGEMQEVTDALTVSQKILSCVYRVRQSFGEGSQPGQVVGVHDDVVGVAGLEVVDHDENVVHALQGHVGSPDRSTAAADRRT